MNDNLFSELENKLVIDSQPEGLRTIFISLQAVWSDRRVWAGMQEGRFSKNKVRIFANKPNHHALQSSGAITGNSFCLGMSWVIWS